MISTFFVTPRYIWDIAVISESGNTIKPTVFSLNGSYTHYNINSEPIAQTTVTFSGVVANSEIRVFLSDGTELAGVENCSTNHALTWNVYPDGSSYNNVVIRIVNSGYKIIELPYTSMTGNITLPIQQQPDKWYSNPI